MPVTRTSYQHIAIDKDGTPLIQGTTMKLVELIAEKNAYGWSPEELWFQHPYLTLGQVYSALAYYADHEEELDRNIEQRLGIADKIRRRAGSSRLVAKLKAKGLP